jgi:hypothetical protein
MRLPGVLRAKPCGTISIAGCGEAHTPKWIGTVAVNNRELTV